MDENIEQKIEQLMSGEEYEGLDELVKLGTKATPKLIEILSKDSDSLMRKRAAIALGRIRDKAALKPLLDSLANETPTIVISLIDALAILGEKKASENIAPLLQNTDPSVRMHAAKALGTLGDKKLMPPLEELLEKDEHDFVRKEASIAMGKIENPFSN